MAETDIQTMLNYLQRLTEKHVEGRITEEDNRNMINSIDSLLTEVIELRDKTKSQIKLISDLARSK